MIVFTRRAARRFRAAARKCVCGRARVPDPPVVLRQVGDRTTLTAAFPEVVLDLAVASPKPGPDAVLVVPMGLIEDAAGPADDPVEVRDDGLRKGTAWWAVGDGTRCDPVELILPGRPHDPPPRPPQPVPVPARFPAALHACGRAAARDDGRFALTRVQVRGQAGAVVGTDGKVAVLFGGFALPFAGDVLVPAVGVFGCPEVNGEPDVRVGRTEAHLVVSAGPWTVWLSPATGRYPDVASAAPRDPPTAVLLTEADVAEVLARLPGLPGAGEEYRPVTLDAGRVLVVRAGDPSIPRGVREVVLARSPVTGPPLRVAVDRRVLARALSLGCRTLRLTPDRPVVAEGDGVTLLAAPLDPALAVPPKDYTRATSAVPTRNPEGSDEMKPNEANGHATRDDPVDPLAAAEELRAALADAAAKAARLATALRAARKERKALTAVYAGLKQLNLDGTGAT